jgi:hypothetical protein
VREDEAVRPLVLVCLLALVACGARSQLAVSQERDAGVGGATTTSSATTTTSTTSTGTGGAAAIVACHPGDPPAVVGTKTGAWGIVVDDTHVYFAGLYTQTVGRVDKLGGAVETLATQQIAPWFVAIDQTHVYWTNSCSVASCGVFASAKAGGTPMEINPMPFVAGIAADDTSVFWIQTNVPSGAVMTMAEPSGPVQKLVAGLDHPWGIALDDSFVYWTDEDAGNIGRVAKGGGPQETVATTSVGAWGLAVDQARVYWSVYAPNTGFVASAPKGGGTPTMLAVNLDQPAGVAVNGDSLYVAVKGLATPGTVLKIPTAGGPAVVVASNQAQPSNVTVDNACVYWSNEDGTIMRAPK